MKLIKKYQRNGKIPFDERFQQIKDPRAKARITMRLDRLAQGNAGDYKQLDAQIYELRIDVGKGWRVYYTHEGDEIILLMLVGDKPKQSDDIQILRSWLNEKT
ncbi:addiction module killer protein [Thiomicrospira aerophila AL3]|uniref:Addiction module killer protein n=1 Tax=Thiomicrospira aerophila AL3 TaxID=717772 RepID=W0DWX6_9GAMM|nr:type II toxin-antitoxin system RelE/ParE family toxin [Thiomicrospira aerophila]AHF01371.1 addiction module killer protein [Thiomicrospira aerophila AL3]